MTSEEVLTFYTGIAPSEWIEQGLEGASVKNLQRKQLLCILHNEMPKLHFVGLWQTLTIMI